MDDFDPSTTVLTMLGSAPRASREELLREWNGPSYQDAYDYLRDRGYLYAGDRWIAPVNPALKDIRAIVFLHLQWEYPKFVTSSPDVIPPYKRQH
jgi:hypothetical protein